MAGVARPGSRRTSPGTGTPSTTSTSRSRCRPTTRRRCSGRCGSTWTAAARTRTAAAGGGAASRREATDAGRGPARPGAPGGVPPAAALGPGDGAAARGRARRRRAGLAAAAPHARASSARRLVAAGWMDRADDVFWLRPDGDPRGATGPARGGRGAAPGAVAGTAAGHAAAGAARGAAGGTGLRRAGSPRRRTSRPAPCCAASAPAPGRSPRPRGCSAGPADFGRMQPGDVLVASITTPAWTSLFAMAAAVVTDVGGPLSAQLDRGPRVRHPGGARHDVATRRIPDGARVRVDGDARHRHPARRRRAIRLTGPAARTRPPAARPG